MKSILAMLTVGAIGFSGAAFAGDDGAKLFSKNCVTCHGKDGKGETDIGEAMQITNLTDPKVQARLTDDGITKQISEGSTDKATGAQKMPAFKATLKPEEIKALVGFVRSFKK